MLDARVPTSAPAGGGSAATGTGAEDGEPGGQTASVSVVGVSTHALSWVCLPAAVATGECAWELAVTGEIASLLLVLSGMARSV